MTIFVSFASLPNGAEDLLRVTRVFASCADIVRRSAGMATTSIAKCLTLILGGQYGARAP